MASGSSSEARITHSTISGNAVTAASRSEGGGIWTQATGGTSLTGATVTKNIAGTGANVATSESSILFQNTIVSSPLVSQSLGSNCAVLVSGARLDGGYNLEDANSCGFSAASHSLVNTSPKLGPLQPNGGPTETHALLAGSPAIDKGNSFSNDHDQRGLNRPEDIPAVANASGGEGADIGAFEAQLNEDMDSDGKVNGVDGCPFAAGTSPSGCPISLPPPSSTPPLTFAVPVAEPAPTGRRAQARKICKKTKRKNTAALRICLRKADKLPL